MEKFNERKAQVQEAYQNYLDLINNFTHEDLKNFDKRMFLLDAYIRTVETNAAFRELLMYQP